MLYKQRKQYLKGKRSKYDEVLYKNLTVIKQAKVAVTKWSNGFFHLHQGHFADDELNRKIMHLTPHHFPRI